MNKTNPNSILVQKRDAGLRILPCMFFDGVLCSYRRDAKFGMLARCFNCSHYSRFMQEMEDEDKKIDAEIEKIHRTGVHD
jgi:hypothetical protein